jgi:transposase
MARGRKICADVQQIVVQLSSLLSREDIAAYTSISITSVNRILLYFEQHGAIDDEPKERHKRAKLLRDEDVNFLFETIQGTPDAYLDELRDMLTVNCGIHVSRSTVWRTLRAGGFTMKKLSRTAIEHSEEKRLAYVERISQYTADQLVFVDESSVDRRTTYRGSAWSIRGTQAQRKAFFVRGRRFSVLPAISYNDGIIHCEIVEGSFCTESFQCFVRRLLDQMQPFPAPNSVIVMDNCRIHKHPDIIELIESRGMRCEFLPPYSPDFNPIELAFSAMKYHLQRNGDLVRMAMTELSDNDIYICLLDALYIISPADCKGWYKYCGY